jgi:2-oxoglutarate dehydrogenase E1 component
MSNDGLNAMSTPQELHTLALSSAYIQDILDRYRSEPASLASDWRAALDLIDGYFPQVLEERAGGPAGAAAFDLVRRFAHLGAALDPLGRPLDPPGALLRDGFARMLLELSPAGANDAALKAILERYAGALAIETGHIDDAPCVQWIHSRRERTAAPEPETSRRALQLIARAEAFERFMAVRFTGKKRFGAEGAESLHALLGRLFDRAAQAGIQEVVIGTMHRGRLGLMVNLLAQPAGQMFARMKGEYPLPDPGRSADVPYHMGLDTRIQTRYGPLAIRLLPNPSHLEAINCVALGYARHRQDRASSPAHVLPIVLHTDASVIAQGVVAEGVQLAHLPGYTVRGALHIIVNNQIGFTTNPADGRSSRHCSGAWKAIDSLIAHVNAYEVDAVIEAADLCFDFRREFGSESVIDLVCVRRNGHNEVDEPRFTQGSYYAVADALPPISEGYARSLVAKQIIEPAFVASVQEACRRELDEAYAHTGSAVDRAPQMNEPESATFAPLESIAREACRLPAAGNIHPKVRQFVAQRAEELATGISWATAELLSLGSILSAGWSVRLAGQDVERGAFSQRHLGIIDTVSGERYGLYQERPVGWGTFQIFNSPLSEYAALAFEYGYSLGQERSVSLWEAQFGDFANCAQAVFDQFICSGEEKWGQHSNLVVLLPHGLEGQGPEHSSARIERMLQLAANDNLRLAHPSTPANYFHLLRSQICRTPRRPLLAVTPKKLLRLKAALSPRGDLERGAFEPILVTPAASPANTLILCSGKIYYDLMEILADGERPAITVIRLEQLYPFPAVDIARALASSGASDICWLQEEPANFGAWQWLRGRLEQAMAAAGLPSPRLRCVSRPECPSPAGSFHAEHMQDQRRLIDAAIGASIAAQPG